MFCCVPVWPMAGRLELATGTFWMGAMSSGAVRAPVGPTELLAQPASVSDRVMTPTAMMLRALIAICRAPCHFALAQPGR